MVLAFQLCRNGKDVLSGYNKVMEGSLHQHCRYCSKVLELEAQKFMDPSYDSYDSEPLNL